MAYEPADDGDENEPVLGQPTALMYAFGGPEDSIFDNYVEDRDALEIAAPKKQLPQHPGGKTDTQWSRDELLSSYGQVSLRKGAGSALEARRLEDAAPFLDDASATVGLSAEDRNVLYAIVKRESGFDPVAQNSAGTASGFGQVTSGTWPDIAKKMDRTDWGHEILVAHPKYRSFEASRFNPEANAIFTAALLKFNEQALGTNASPGAKYMAHFLGVGSAMQFSAQNENVLASSVLSSRVIAANRNVLAGRTVGQVLAWAEKGMTNVAPGAVAFNTAVPAGLRRGPPLKGVTPNVQADPEYVNAQPVRGDQHKGGMSNLVTLGSGSAPTFPTGSTG